MLETYFWSLFSPLCSAKPSTPALHLRASASLSPPSRWLFCLLLFSLLNFQSVLPNQCLLPNKDVCIISSYLKNTKEHSQICSWLLTFSDSYLQNQTSWKTIVHFLDSFWLTEICVLHHCPEIASSEITHCTYGSICDAPDIRLQFGIQCWGRDILALMAPQIILLMRLSTPSAFFWWNFQRTWVFSPQGVLLAEGTLLHTPHTPHITLSPARCRAPCPRPHLCISSAAQFSSLLPAMISPPYPAFRCARWAAHLFSN